MPPYTRFPLSEKEIPHPLGWHFTAAVVESMLNLKISFGTDEGRYSKDKTHRAFEETHNEP